MGLVITLFGQFSRADITTSGNVRYWPEFDELKVYNGEVRIDGGSQELILDCVVGRYSSSAPLPSPIGVITITGADSRLSVGGLGGSPALSLGVNYFSGDPVTTVTGIVNVLDGATLSTSGTDAFLNSIDSVLGLGKGGFGRIRVSGAGSTFYCWSGLHFGETIGIEEFEGVPPYGELVVENGGRAIFERRPKVGGKATKSRLIIRGAGSTCTFKTGASLGPASMRIEDGGLVTVEDHPFETSFFAVPQPLILSGAGSTLTVLPYEETTPDFPPGYQDDYFTTYNCTMGAGTVINAVGGVENTGAFTVNVDSGTALNIGAGDPYLHHFINRNGATLRFVAGPAAPAGTYTPVTFAHPEGDVRNTIGSTLKAVGGTWNDAANTFTVPPVEYVEPSPPAQDWSSRRIRKRSSWFRWARRSFRIPSFEPLPDPVMPDGLNVSFSATVGTATFDTVELAAGPIDGEQSLVAYQITSPISLTEASVALYVGGDFLKEELGAWCSSDGGASWDPLDPASYGFDDGWVTFPETACDGFAVTTKVPVGAPVACWIDYSPPSSPAVSFARGSENRYAVWASDILSSDWTCLGIVEGGTGDGSLVDARPIVGRRFYQVRRDGE